MNVFTKFSLIKKGTPVIFHIQGGGSEQFIEWGTKDLLNARGELTIAGGSLTFRGSFKVLCMLIKQWSCAMIQNVITFTLLYSFNDKRL